eukprot:TRINITY_DN9_c3_g1_i1.p1 TRINITY_DN9_c3_g1~~TRINITY_DN9_c3_g1_i1.p1  ORF type:complete len:533 (+),score=107.59 TRINITY_DN9_c3_g1_i1:62-1660(+)
MAGSAPSPVIMVRTVPQGVTEKDLEAWAKSYTMPDGFGGYKQTTCVKSLLLADRMIGFVQMGDVGEASFIMNLYWEQPEQVRMVRPTGTHLLNLIYSDKQEIKAQPRARNVIQTSNTRILLVVLKDLSATIMMDELFWIFSQFGVVEKLSSFTKNLKNQVLVQYATQEPASAAMAYLNGREITFHSPSMTGTPSTGNCRLVIAPSKLPELTFKNQDQKNRDYSQINSQLHHYMQVSAHSGTSLRAILTDVVESMHWRVRDFLWGSWVLGEGWLDPVQDRNLQGSIPEQQVRQGIPEGRVGDCVHISGIALDGNQVTAEQLWRVCGMYGDLVAVKMLFKYEGSAIVQFTHSEYAKACIQYLSDAEFWGKKWDVKESKNANAMHWSGANTELEDRMCTKEKVMSPALPPVFNFSKPCNCLLLWDVPASIDEDDLVDIFNTKGSMMGVGGGVRQVQKFESENRAEIVFETVEDALVAVANLNGVTVDVPNKDTQYLMKMHFDKVGREDEYDMPRTHTAVEEAAVLSPFMMKTWTA